MQQIGPCRTSLSRGRAKPNSQVVRRRAAPLTVKAGSSYYADLTLIYQLSPIWYSVQCDPAAPFRGAEDVRPMVTSGLRIGNRGEVHYTEAGKSNPDDFGGALSAHRWRDRIAL